MSDTDKTKPVPVRLRQEPGLGREHHDHRDGVCNLLDGVRDYQSPHRTRWDECDLWTTTSYYSGARPRLYSEPQLKYWRHQAERKARSRLRMGLSRVRAAAPEDRDLVIEPYRQRGSARYECW